MVGLFSMLDTLMHRSIDVVLKDLPISLNIKKGIIGNEDSIYSDVLDLIVAYEEGNWMVVDKYCDRLNIEGNFLINAFLLSINWEEEVLSF
jgi:EAL and modified HD-GYP domain-containing signal transduction protein